MERLLPEAAFRGGHIAYQLLGPSVGDWLVFCHGMGLDAQNMAELARRFASDWRILLWDLPGHGDSDAVDHYRLDVFADALECVLADAGATNVVLVGFSFGGMIAQYAMARAPQRYRALVAYGCFAPFHQSPPVAKPLIGPVIASYRLQSWKQLTGKFAPACAVTAEGQAEVKRAVARCTKPVFIGVVRALLAGFDAGRTLGFNGPMLILRGENDSNHAMLEKAAAALKIGYPHAQERIIANAGHCAHNDALDAVFDALNRFLDSLELPPAVNKAKP